MESGARVPLPTALLFPSVPLHRILCDGWSKPATDRDCRGSPATVRQEPDFQSCLSKVTDQKQIKAGEKGSFIANKDVKNNQVRTK